MPYPTQIRHIVASLAETQSQVDVIEGHLNRLRNGNQNVKMDLSYGTHSDDINGNPKIKLEGDALIALLEKQRDALEDKVVDLSNRVIDQTRDNQNDRSVQVDDPHVSAEEIIEDEHVPLAVPGSCGAPSLGKNSAPPRPMSPEDDFGL